MKDYIEDKRFPGNRIHSTAMINNNVRMGKGNTIMPYAVIGYPGFIRDAENFKGVVNIGNNNRIGCYVNIMVGKEDSTYIGSNNLIMNHVNIGHNCVIENDCEIGAGTIVNGYATIKKEVKIKSRCVIRNRITIDNKCVIGQGSNVVKDIKEGTYYGNPATKRTKMEVNKLAAMAGIKQNEFNSYYKVVGTNIIAKDFEMGDNFEIGDFNIIHSNCKVGDNVRIENFCVLESNVLIGNDTKLKSYIELRKNTVIGDECYIDSKVSSSGECVIGDRVTLRYETIIARGCDIGDDTYMCPRVMTNNLDTGKNKIGGAKVGKNCFIGTHTVLHHGIKIADKVVVGAMSFVNKDCEESGIYIGTPAKLKK